MWRVIGFFFRSSWKVIVFAAVSSAAAAAANLYSLKLLGQVITIEDTNLYVLIGYISLLIIGSSIITLFSGKYVTRYFEAKVANYRKELATKALQSNYSLIEKKLDRLVPVLLFETGSIGGFGKSIPDLMVAVFQSVVVLTYLFLLSWVLTLAFLPIFIIITVTNVATLPLFKKIEETISETRFKLHFSLDRLEKGFKDLIVNKQHSRSYIDNSVDSPSQSLVNLSVKNFFIRTLLGKSQNAFLIICLGLLIVYAMTNSAFTEGELIEYMALILYIRPSLNRIAGFTKQVKVVENALEQVESLDVDLKDSLFRSELKVNYDGHSKSPLIKVDDISYSYSGKNSFAIESMNFEIFRNEIVIINGSNGSGKSTLFKLIIGLYTPKSGEITFQDQSLSKDNLESYRNHFSCYFTDSPLFDDLGYVASKQKETEIEELIELLGLSNKTSLDDGFKITNSNLSNGQKGRLNLLRLLLEDREIYFLDEWAANQDIYFKEKFYTEIIPDLKKRGKTIILISHDDKFYSVADRIITLRNGKIENMTTSNVSV
ncbi:putative ATP-binding cassette transporter [Ekhidna lutea]|uniref:Putative ATP-binding cassette transporter n=1 Tax=Ekhidna lutea TaxID=447679 RepID=A0A239FQ00_EKHLU|nr:ATP-binding cassette domain-containing protein [Ekhidna lutea]SNS58890.1 putative ATP-binding cassette transporter [Ekhidna lutea]